MRRMAAVAIIFMLAVTGCAATQQARFVEKSGFLQEYYPLMHEGKRSIVGESAEDQALLVFINQKPDWRKYKKIYLDNVTVWVGKDGQLSKVKPADRQRMADVAFAKFHEALAKDYEIVNQHGPDTMWMQFAITEADSSYPVLDTISSLIPQARMASGLKSVATGVSAFTGSASGEFKVTDSESGDLLGAAVDRRGGTKSLMGVTDSWNDVEEAYRFWAEKVRYRLCQFRKDSNCIKPKA
jgi:hypothetical protein